MIGALFHFFQCIWWYSSREQLRRGEQRAASRLRSCSSFFFFFYYWGQSHAPEACLELTDIRHLSQRMSFANRTKFSKDFFSDKVSTDILTLAKGCHWNSIKIFDGIYWEKPLEILSSVGKIAKFLGRELDFWTESVGNSIKKIALLLVCSWECLNLSDRFFNGFCWKRFLYLGFAFEPMKLV